eukprot:jgi/Botrbrau1/15212/Bobra.0149s0068.3
MSLRFRQLEKLERVREETESLQRELDAREDVIKSAGSPKSGPDASGQPSRGSAGRKSLRERVHVGEPGGLAGRNFKSIDAGTPSAHGALPADFGMPRDTHVFAPQGETALHDLQNAALFEESISSGAPAARIGDAHWLAAKRRSGDLRYRYLIPPDYVAVGGAAQGGLPGSAVQGDGAPGGFHRSAVQHQPTAEATAPEDTANVQDFEKTELVGRGEPHDDLAEDLWDWEGVSRRPAVSREAPANRKKGAPRRRKGAPAPSAGQEKRPRVDKAASGELAGQATMGPSLADVLAHGPDEPLLLREEGPDPSSGTALEKVVPASINRYLRGYQREGVRFLFRQYAKGEGGILADDMGLGKTVQTIAFVAAILPSPVSTAPAPPNSQATPTRSGPVLIVVPTSLLTNWEREFNMWGTFRIAIYHGINRGASLTAAASGNLQVLLTSYDTVRLYIEDLLTVDWHVVICDEAHRLKNDRSKIYSCASKFPTKLRYGLTGTPMQNSYEELWTLLEWARPGALGSASQFREYYAKPLKEGQRSDADLRMLAKAKKRQVQLTKVLNKYLLRRTKEGSIKDQLPTKTDHIVFCALSPLQARAYRRCLNQVDFQRLIRASEECGCGSRLTQAMCCRPGSHGELFRIQHLCECQEPACKWHSGEDGCDFCPYCIMFRCVRVLECVSNHLDLVKVDRSLANDGSAGAGRRRLLARMVLGEDEEAAGGLLLDDAFLSTPLASSTCVSTPTCAHCLCTLPLHTACTHLLYTPFVHHLYTPFVHHLYTPFVHHLYTICTHRLCTPPVHTACTHLLYTPFVHHLYSPFVHHLYTPFVHHLYTPFVHHLYTPLVHTTCPHRLYAPLVHTICTQFVHHLYTPFVHHLYTPFVHHLYTPLVHTTCPYRLYAPLVHTICTPFVHTICTPFVHTACAHHLSTPPVRTSCTHHLYTICTHHLYTICTHRLCTPPVHTACTHHLYTPLVHTACTTPLVHATCTHRLYAPLVDTACMHHLYTPLVHTACPLFETRIIVFLGGVFLINVKIYLWIIFFK